MTELLIVLGLVAILALLLLPTFRGAMESARMTECVQRLKNLGALTLLSSQERNGDLSWYKAPQGTPGMWWYRSFQSTNFNGFNEAMTCPDQRKAPYAFRYSPQGRALQGNYRYNKHLGYQNSSAGWIYKQWRLNTVEQPHRVAMIADYAAMPADRSDDSLGFETWAPITSSHRDKRVGQVFCLDGHVEIIKADTPHTLVLSPLKL